MRSMALLVPAAVLCGLSGCDVDYETERGQIGLSDNVLIRDVVERFESGDAVLVGSRACPRFEGYYEGQNRQFRERDEDDDLWLRTCFEPAVDGPAALDVDACLRFDDVGEVRWVLNPRPCDLAVAFEPDLFRFDVVGPGAVTGRLDPWQRRWLERHASPGPAGVFPADWMAPASEPWQIFPGTRMPVRIGLWRSGAPDQPVAWSDAGASATAAAGAPLVEGSGAPNELTITVADGEQLDFALQATAVDVPAGSAIGVAEDSVASLELVGAYDVGADPSTWHHPIAVIAVVRDGDDRLVLGAPVAWTIDGPADLTQDSRESGLARRQDHLLFTWPNADACDPNAAGQSREATIRASLAGLDAELPLSWTVAACAPEPEPEPEDPDLDGDDGGVFDCACDARGEPGPGLAWTLVGIGLAFLRRRRRG